MSAAVDFCHAQAKGRRREGTKAWRRRGAKGRRCTTSQRPCSCARERSRRRLAAPLKQHRHSQAREAIRQLLSSPSHSERSSRERDAKDGHSRVQRRHRWRMGYHKKERNNTTDSLTALLTAAPPRPAPTCGSRPCTAERGRRSRERSRAGSVHRPFRFARTVQSACSCWRATS